MRRTGSPRQVDARLDIQLALPVKQGDEGPVRSGTGNVWRSSLVFLRDSGHGLAWVIGCRDVLSWALLRGA